MADLSKNDVLKLGRLSRLKLSDSEVTEFQKEMNEILEYVQMLDTVDTKGLKPTYQVTGLKNATRPDKIIDYGVTPKELMKNAPDTDGSYLKVKRMIG